MKYNVKQGKRDLVAEETERQWEELNYIIVRLLKVCLTCFNGLTIKDKNGMQSIFTICSKITGVKTKLKFSLGVSGSI